ncbi:MAG: WbqC family protein, partial [Desulfobacterales bacterium]|nr:WbqC family protein [Desulfobacterales bacterium]
LNLTIIRYMLRQLKIDTEIKLLSEFGIQTAGSQGLVEICKCLGASTYLVQHAAGKYLDGALFEQKDIELKFFKRRACVYPQLWGRFVPDLSIFDLLLNCGPRAPEILISGSSQKLEAV